FAGVGVLDLDDRPDAYRGGAGERGRAELDQAIDVGEGLLGALLLGAAEAGELVGGAGVFALLVGGRAIACFGGGGIAGRQGRAGGGFELADELVDELLLVHVQRFARGRSRRKFLCDRRRHAELARPLALDRRLRRVHVVHVVSTA